MTQKMRILILLVVAVVCSLASSMAVEERSDRESAQVKTSSSSQLQQQHERSPYHIKRRFFSHTLGSEFRRFFDHPLLYVVANLNNTTLQNDTSNTTTSTNITDTITTTTTPAIAPSSPMSLESSNNNSSQHNETVPLLNDGNMMLFNWINWTNSSIPFPNVGISSTSAVAKRMSLAEMFQYNTSWIIGLAVIATVIGVFFLGCVIVICYTRRPYRRSGKIYEIESTAKKSQKIPQVPTIHPATKTATLTRNKELYY